MISVADNFSYQGSKPLDGRIKYDTIAAMKAVADATMYDGCLAYCSATDKTYQWKSTNTVDADTGRWREFSSGGSGEDPNAYHTTDTAETTLADSDKFPFYDASATAARHSTWSNLKAKLKSYFDTVYDLNKSDIPMYGTSSTTSSTAAKTASVTRGTFSLVAGAKVSIKFTYANTASAPTLNVGSTGVKNIKYIDSNGTVTTPTTWWGAGDVVSFVYDGTQWLMQPIMSLAQPNVAYGFTPVGTVISLMGKTAPTNFLICDGSTYNISTYPELANYFQAQFGSKNYFGGNGSTTFAVPDLRGEFLRGSGTNGHSGQGSGSNVGTHQDATRSRLYALNQSNDLVIQKYNNSTEGGWAQNVDAYNDSGLVTGYIWQKIATGQDSINSFHTYYSQRPTNTSVLYCIAVKNIYMNPADTYSTSEQVVGKWIDGSKLYQKTISTTTPSTTSSTKTVTLGTSYNVFFIDAMCKPSSGGAVPVPWCLDGIQSGNTMWIFQDITSGDLKIQGASNIGSTFLNAPLYITIKYTK